MSTLDLSNASFLSVNSQSRFLGDNLNVSRVETISVRGFIDKRTDNDDYIGVREVLGEISSMLANNDDYWTDNLIINGHTYGKGRVTALNFSSSPDGTTNMVNLGEYTATIEIYKQGDLFGLSQNESGILGHHYPTKTAMQNARHEYLQNFSFNTTWNDVNGRTTVDERVSISYLSGESSFNPKLAARNLANELLGYSSGHLNDIKTASIPSNANCRTGNYSEEYDDINLNYNFGRSITFNDGDVSCPYDLRTSRSLNFDQNGNIEVSEKGEIFGNSLGHGYMGANKSGNAWGLNEGLRIELSNNNSYTRCNTMFNQYTGLANQSATNIFSLSSTPIEVGKSVDSGAGVGSYTIKYTNNQRLSGTFINEWNQSISMGEDNNVSVSENGTVREYGGSSSYSANKRPDFNTSPASSYYGRNYSDIVTASQSRAEELYDKFTTKMGITSCSNKNNLKLVSENRDHAFFGPQFTYTREYSDNPSILSDADAATIGWKQVTVSEDNSIAVPNSKEYLIPRQGVNGELVQIMDQMSLGVLTITVNAIQQSPKNYFIDNTPPDAEIKKLIDNYVLPVCHDFPGKSTVKITQMWISDINYTFDSNYNCTLTATINFTVENYL